jgi:DNA replication protein DnaC
MVRSAPPREHLSPENLARRGIPRLYFQATIDQYDIDEEIRDTFARYLENLDDMFDDNVNLVLYGVNGSGKTYLSSLIIKEAYRLRYSSYMITFQNYLNLTFGKDEESKEYIHSINNCEFLVLDEIGKEIDAINNYNVIVLENLLKIRETLGHPTILCMNLNLDNKDGFYEQYGNSIKSLVDGNYVKIKFAGRDFRYDVTRRKRGVKLLFDE